jgi:hypothetical protein
MKDSCLSCFVEFGGLRPQSGLSDILLFFPGGWWAFPVEAAQGPPRLLGLPCPVNCNGSAGSRNKSAERRDQRTRADGVTVCPVRHSKSVCAVPFNRASRYWPVALMIPVIRADLRFRIVRQLCLLASGRGFRPTHTDKQDPCQVVLSRESTDTGHMRWSKVDQMSQKLLFCVRNCLQLI